MRSGALLPLIAALALPGAVCADVDKATYKPDIGLLKRPPLKMEAGLPRFVTSNIRETIYHELAHLFVHQLDLALFGPEEFAADLFAAVMIHRLHDEDAAVAITYDVAAAYDAGVEKEKDYGAVMWGVHGTDEQRYYNFVCMMYGANPDERDDVARELGLPDERAETCEDEYDLADRAWGEVLDRLAVGAPGASLRFDDGGGRRGALARFVANEVARLNEIMSLPRTTTVSVTACEEINAFYDPARPEILICTELGEHLAKLAR